MATALACGSEVEYSEPPPPQVSVITVAEREIPDRFEFSGRLVAVNTVDARARVEGELIERNFVEGQPVEKGQLLFQIDPARFEAEVARLRAELERIRATLNKNERDLERTQALQRQGVASRAELDRVTAAAQESRATLQAQEAALSRAELDLGYTTIYATIDGVIGRVRVDVGNLVGPSTGPLATITQLDPIYAVFGVSSRTVLGRQRARREREERGEEAGELRATLRLADGSSYDHEGELDYSDPDVRATTGTLDVRGVFPNPDRLLRPGMYATVVLSSEGTLQRIVVPQAAVRESQLGTTVFVVDDENRAATRKVQLGARRGSDWIVEDGLESGEKVIVQGLQKVRPGGLVTPVASDEPTAG